MLIDCFIDVQKNAILKIRPGTTIILNSDNRFLIDGVLNARGLPGDSIKFTSPDRNWHGLYFNRFNDASTLKGDTSFLDRCIIENSKWNGVTIDRSEVKITDSIISNNDVNGIVAGSGFPIPSSTGSSPFICSNTISLNKWDGISLTPGTSVIKGQFDRGE